MPHHHLRPLRHAIGCAFLVPLLGTLIFRSPEEKATWTKADARTVAVANYIGDASFALTGSLAAGVEGMDLLGCVVVGFITALGGGSFRDLVLGKTPLFWMVHWDEALLCVLVGAATFFLWPIASRRLGLTSADEWLFWTDTLGLAVFAANGAYAGSTVASPPLHAAACGCCGMFTATFGGLTRDVLLGRPPRILYSHMELYALPALLGGLATTAMIRTSPGLVMESVLLGIWVTVLGRVLAINHGLRLPTFPEAATFSEAARPRDAAAAIARMEELRWKRSVAARALPLDESLLGGAVPQSVTMPSLGGTCLHCTTSESVQ